MMEPAPMKPMPGMIWAAMRAASEGTPANCADRSVNMAAPKQMNIFVRRPAGRCLYSRSRPIAPPRKAESRRRIIEVATMPLANSWWMRSRKCCQFMRTFELREASFGWPDFITATVSGCVNRNDYRTRGSPKAVEHSGGLSGNVNGDQLAEVQVVNRLPHRVAFKGEDVVGILLRVGEGAFPETFWIGWLLPGAVVAFVDGVAQRDTSAFDGSDVVP